MAPTAANDCPGGQWLDPWTHVLGMQTFRRRRDQRFEEVGEYPQKCLKACLFRQDLGSCYRLTLIICLLLRHISTDVTSA